MLDHQSSQQATAEHRCDGVSQRFHVLDDEGSHAVGLGPERPRGAGGGLELDQDGLSPAVRLGPRERRCHAALPDAALAGDEDDRLPQCTHRSTF